MEKDQVAYLHQRGIKMALQFKIIMPTQSGYAVTPQFQTIVNSYFSRNHDLLISLLYAVQSYCSGITRDERSVITTTIATHFISERHLKAGMEKHQLEITPASPARLDEIVDNVRYTEQWQ